MSLLLLLFALYGIYFCNYCFIANRKWGIYKNNVNNNDLLEYFACVWKLMTYFPCIFPAIFLQNWFKHNLEQQFRFNLPNNTHFSPNIQYILIHVQYFSEVCDINMSQIENKKGLRNAFIQITFLEQKIYC